VLEAAEVKRFTMRELVDTGKCLAEALHARGAAATNDKIAKITSSYQLFEDNLWKIIRKLQHALLSTDFDVCCIEFLQFLAKLLLHVCRISMRNIQKERPSVPISNGASGVETDPVVLFETSEPHVSQQFEKLS
jgi:hypothetical protein